MFEVGLWSRLLGIVRLHRRQVATWNFRATIGGVTPTQTEFIQESLLPYGFSSWVAPHLSDLDHCLVLKRPGVILTVYLNGGDHIPWQVEAALVRLCSIREWLGDATELRAYYYHIESQRRAVWEKELPGPKEVNGGMTSSVCRNPIHCWRAEEAPKVFVHEYLHSLCLDQDLRSVTLCPGRRECSANLAEAWVETWATLWNAAHVTLEQSSDAGLDEFVDNLERERMFVLDQAAHVCARGGYKTWAEVTEDVEPWDEDTNVFSYFVIRAAWLFHPDEFLRVSPSPRISAPETLRYVAESVFASSAWAKEIDRRIGVASASTPEVLRMTSLEHPGKNRSLKAFIASEGTQHFHTNK